jgi:hypothetical protein
MFNIPQFHVEFTPSTRILRGLDEIGAYLKVHRRTAWRWIMDYGFPAMQAPNGTWMSSTSLVDLWILSVQSMQRQTKPRAIDPSDVV